MIEVSRFVQKPQIPSNAVLGDLALNPDLMVSVCFISELEADREPWTFPTGCRYTAISTCVKQRLLSLISATYRGPTQCR